MYQISIKKSRETSVQHLVRAIYEYDPYFRKVLSLVPNDDFFSYKCANKIVCLVDFIGKNYAPYELDICDTGLSIAAFWDIFRICALIMKITRKKKSLRLPEILSEAISSLLEDSEEAYGIIIQDLDRSILGMYNQLGNPYDLSVKRPYDRGLNNMTDVTVTSDKAIIGKSKPKYANIMDIPEIKALPQMVDCGGVKVPLGLFIDPKQKTVKDILAQPNAEVRRILINLYPGRLEAFLKDGGGTVVKEAVNERDYQDARVISMALESASNSEPNYYILMINQTIEPGAESLTEEQRLKQGLTADGRKKYITKLIGKPSDYPTMWDVMGSTWGLGIGEYHADFEA